MGSPVAFAPLTANTDLGKAFLSKCFLKQQSSCLRGLAAPRLCDNSTNNLYVEESHRSK